MLYDEREEELKKNKKKNSTNEKKSPRTNEMMKWNCFAIHFSFFIEKFFTKIFPMTIKIKIKIKNKN